MGNGITLSNRIFALFTVDLPILLLGINFILYNAFDFDDFKNIIRILAFSLLIIGGVLDLDALPLYNSPFFCLLSLN